MFEEAREVIDSDDRSVHGPMSEAGAADGDDEPHDIPGEMPAGAALHPCREPSVEVLAGLLQRIARQDEAAFGELYDATVGRIHGMALRILRNPQAAEEATEDAFFQIWRQAPRFDPTRGRPLAWMLTIVRSRALDQLRRADDAILHPDPAGLVGPESGPAAEPAALVIELETRTTLHQALYQLDPVPRQMIALAFFRGLTHEELAAHAGLPIGTVKSHIRRALGVLRQALEAHPATTRSET